MSDDDEPVIRINMSREAFEAALNAPPSLEQLALKNNPGRVVFLDSWPRQDGVMVFSAAVECLPAGTTSHVMSEHYPRIVGALKAQGCRIKPDAILTLVSAEELEL